MEAINRSESELTPTTIDQFIKISIIHFANEIRTRLTHAQFRKLIRYYREDKEMVKEFERLIHLSLDIDLYEQNYEKFVKLFIENDIYYDIEFNYSIQPLLMFYTFLYTKNRINLESRVYMARLLKITHGYRYSKNINQTCPIIFSPNVPYV